MKHNTSFSGIDCRVFLRIGTDWRQMPAISAISWNTTVGLYDSPRGVTTGCLIMCVLDGSELEIVQNSLGNITGIKIVGSSETGYIKELFKLDVQRNSLQLTSGISVDDLVLEATLSFKGVTLPCQ